MVLKMNRSSTLWIDFKLYFYVRIHKNGILLCLSNGVVNWFQIVFLREDSQVLLASLILVTGCELISNCIFTWGFTSRKPLVFYRHELWIDFKLYFYVRIHKSADPINWDNSVVNWFQIVFLREDSQEQFSRIIQNFCCELISNCIFTWGFTSYKTV